MRALIALLAMARLAHAQPDPAPIVDPYPQPLPPQPVVVEPQPEPQQIVLTSEEAALLQRGEIGPDLLTYGIVANALVGFGLGQAIQGRWKQAGWKFTLGQSGGMVLFFTTAGSDGNIGVQLLAAGTLLTFYVWGIIDAATGPQRHNIRVRDVKLRHGIPLAMPYVAKHEHGSTAGVVFRF